MAKKSVVQELGTLGALLRAPLDVLIAYVYGRLAEEGFGDIRAAHGAVIRHMPKDGCRITELADKARMTKQSMAELVEALRDRGYVTIAADRNDRRAKTVKFTKRGWQAQAALVRFSHSFEEECARALGEAAWLELRRGLERLAAWAERYAEDQTAAEAESKA